MKPTDRNATTIATTLAVLILVAILAASFLVGCSLRQEEPDPFAVDVATEGVTNLTDLTLAGDLSVGDDVTITDDMTVDSITGSGDLILTGNISAAAITGSGLGTFNGGLKVDNTAFTVADTSGNVSTAGNLTASGASALNGGLTMDTTAFTVADTTGNTVISGTLTITGTTTVTGGITSNYGIENISLPTVVSATVTYQSDGAQWTIADGEIWYIHAAFCNITTNFDCTGDDCTFDVGDGGDQDGLLDLDDAELQTTDTEGTGAPAGWQGIMGNATRGAYLAEGIGFIYAPSGAAETVDVTVGGTDPAAGAGTCYLVYTRLE